MIKIAFIASQRKIIKFEIENKIVIYYDDIWKKGIQLIPKDQNIINKLRRSGKMNLKMMVALILDANKGENLKEYNACKTDEEVADIIRNESKSKGLMEIK